MNKDRPYRCYRFAGRKQVAQFLLLIAGCSLLATHIGCEAFVRKFTRKKKQPVVKEEMVLEPQEYPAAGISKEEMYRQYFILWRSWHDELIASLSAGSINHKKQMSCVQQTLKHIGLMKGLLNEKKQQQMNGYIEQLNRLAEIIEKDAYGHMAVMNRQQAERIKRNILRDFPYNKIKDNLTS
jgi:hypothetical protein